MTAEETIPGATVRSYRDLIVWRKSIGLVKATYQVTSSFPSDERFGLTQQMRKASVSVPSNIAEGQARRTTKEFIQFISHAEGSLAELETQILVSIDLGLGQELESRSLLSRAEEIRRMLNGLRRRLSKRTPRG